MPITSLNYLQHHNYRSEQNLQGGYLREIIHSFGIATTYLRADLDFYESPSGNNSNYTYGENTSVSYWLSAPMSVYFFAENDTNIFSQLGIQNDSSHKVSFMVDDFYEQFRDQIGTVTTGSFEDINIYADINSGSGYLSGSLSANEFDAITSGYIDFMGTTGEVSGHYKRNVIGKYKAVNELIYNPRYYRYDDRYISGEALGTFSGNIDTSGNGSLVGTASSELLYITGPAENAGPHWNIAPQVGDFFRINFQNDNLPGYIGQNHEEYEITQIHDRNLLDNDTNPLLGTYTWTCDVTRRDPSHENIITDSQEEEHTVDKLEQNVWHENISNNIFNYDITDADQYDVVNSDDVYGSY